jgi:hypothetical protein
VVIVALALGPVLLATGGNVASSGAGAAEDPGSLPSPSAALPRDPKRLAERLTEISGALRSSIDAWLQDGDPSRGLPPTAVTLQALYQQRVYRLLARRPVLAARTLRRLPGWLEPTARHITAALRALGRLTRPTTHVRRFRTGRPLPAGVLLRYYRLAQRRFGVAAHVLAAVNFVESGFGRLKNDSVAGARGPMQFLPGTWRVYGMGGNVRDPHDAILGAANLLRHSGAPRNYRRALFSYNPSRLYVEAVLRYARRIARSRSVYFALYSWQVFVRTPSGDLRLTGPGLPGR